MRKLKLYLDTSVISHIDVPHKPVEESATRAFFRYIKEHADEYELCISPVAFFEIHNCPEPKRTVLFDFLDKLHFVELNETEDVLNLADLYIVQGVLGVKHRRDLTHIAYAVASECDYIISWNFEHFVNHRTIQRVNAVNLVNNYRSVEIVIPPIITGENLNAEV